jgi:lysophospholipase L1-like esterase
MSWQTDITQAIANLTQRLNDITTSAKKIYELTWQNILNPASKIHVSNSENQSEFITVQQILDAAISYKQNELIEATVSVDANDVTVDAGAKWIINNINHELVADFEETIPYAETGNTRNDILVGNESNLIIRVVGPETEGISPTPNTPLNTVLITTINVTDSTISDIPVVPDTDLNTTDILNVSTVPGATTTDALNYLKDNAGGLLLQQEFIWTSGVQTFTLDYDYAQVFAVLIRGVQAHSSQYTLVAPNQVTIIDTLNVDDYITILYAKASVGVVTTYSKAEIDAFLAGIETGGGTNEYENINYQLFSKLNDNPNFDLNRLDREDWWSFNMARVVKTTDPYLVSLGIVNQINLPLGLGISGGIGTERNVFYRQKYTEDIKGKYYQMTYFIQTSGNIYDIGNFGNSFVINIYGWQTAIPYSSQTITLVSGKTDLYKVVSVGRVPTDQTYFEIYIGSQFQNNSTPTSPAFNMAGFYCGLSDTPYVSTIDGYLVERISQPQLEQLRDEFNVFATGVTTTIPKKIVFMGDSITANTDGWTKNLLQKIKFSSFLNLAVSGAAWRHTAGTTYDITGAGGGVNNVIYNQVNKLIDRVTNLVTQKPDIVCILCGVNDGDVNMGNISTAFTQNYPITGNAPGTILDTITAIRYNCELLLSTYPDLQIILTTPIQRGITDNAALFTISQGIKEAGERLSVTVIDCCSEVGIYGEREAISPYYLSDTLHPNAKGDEKLAGFMATKLISIIHK